MVGTYATADGNPNRYLYRMPIAKPANMTKTSIGCRAFFAARCLEDLAELTSISGHRHMTQV
jgi:hypothetical protein